jgi:hypothetical protein
MMAATHSEKEFKNFRSSVGSVVSGVADLEHALQLIDRYKGCVDISKYLTNGGNETFEENYCLKPWIQGMKGW